MIFYEVEGGNIRFVATDLDTLVLVDMADYILTRRMGYKFDVHEFEETTLLKVYIDRDVGPQERRLQIKEIIDLFKECKNRRK